MAKRVLLIEDEPGLVLTLTDRLTREGYEVEAAGDGEAGYTLARERHFDLILLDLMLPGRSGFDVCRDLRRAGQDTPILMLTARGLVADKVVGLKLGADDYLTKPFAMMELLARIEALLRRVPAPADQPGDSYSFGSVRVDFRGAEVWKDGRPVALSAKEFSLLCCFIAHRGAVLSRDALLNRVWGYEAMPNTRTVDVHVAGLRQKLEDRPSHPRFIVTVHGMGYKFLG
jgi:two-component system, OmpR family, alkaline phosphatase synthesis response regulator PhoP